MLTQQHRRALPKRYAVALLGYGSTIETSQPYVGWCVQDDSELKSRKNGFRPSTRLSAAKELRYSSVTCGSVPATSGAITRLFMSKTTICLPS